VPNTKKDQRAREEEQHNKPNCERKTPRNINDRRGDKTKLPNQAHQKQTQKAGLQVKLK